MAGKRDKSDWDCGRLQMLRERFGAMQSKVDELISKMEKAGLDQLIDVGNEKSIRLAQDLIWKWFKEAQGVLDLAELAKKPDPFAFAPQTPSVNAENVDELTLRAREKLCEAQAIQHQRPAISPEDWAEEQSRKLARSKSAQEQKDKQGKRKAGGG